MIHKINFSILIETNSLREDAYAEIMDVLEAQMKDNKAEGIPFEDFAEVIPLKKLKFHPSTIQYPDMSRDDEDFSIKETRIEIRA